MFVPLSKAQGAWATRIVLIASLTVGLFWQSRSVNYNLRPDDNRREPVSVAEGSNGPADAQRQKQQLSGEQARRYLEQSADGQSLMQAVTAARFGLQRQEHAPFDKRSSAGYLGMSHDQNLNVWFDEAGVTVRPTVPEEKRAHAWQLSSHLKAFGYGEQLIDAPPIVSHEVKGNRIEYERATAVESRIARVGFAENSLFNSQSAIRNPKFIEWYENRPEGIEQGFTIKERPERRGEVAAAEPLRVALSLTGDLRARVKDGGQEIELADERAKAALSYSGGAW